MPPTIGDGPAFPSGVQAGTGVSKTSTLAALSQLAADPGIDLDLVVGRAHDGIPLDHRRDR